MRELTTTTFAWDFLACLGLCWFGWQGLRWVLRRCNRTWAALERDFHRDAALRLTLRLGQWR